MSHSLYICLAVTISLSLSAQPAAAEQFEWAGGKWTPTAQPKEGTAAGELAMVRQLVESGQSGKAVKAAKKFTSRYPDAAAYEQVCLLAGQAELNRHRYYQAYEWFEKQLNQFPSGAYSDRALKHEVEVAEAFLSGQKRVIMGIFKMRAVDEALEILTRVAEHAPGTEIASAAMLRVADYHFTQGQWDSAVNAYDTFMQLFPNSPKTQYAMARAAKATYCTFEGIEFEDTPLLEAEHRYKLYLASFPSAAKADGAPAILKQITATRAQKLHETAQFYERTKRPGPAVFYYKQIISQYPASPLAGDAKNSLIRLGAVKPASPAADLAASRAEPARRGARPDVQRRRLRNTRPDMPVTVAPMRTGEQRPATSKGSAGK